MIKVVDLYSKYVRQMRSSQYLYETKKYYILWSNTTQHLNINLLDLESHQSPTKHIQQEITSQTIWKIKLQLQLPLMFHGLHSVKINIDAHLYADGGVWCIGRWRRWLRGDGPVFGLWNWWRQRPS